jgi:hypothetical protein
MERNLQLLQGKDRCASWVAVLIKDQSMFMKVALAGLLDQHLKEVSQVVER